MKKCCCVCKLVPFLAGVGALNWALVAFANVNLVTTLLGEMTRAAKATYALIGVAGLMSIVSIIKCCPCTGGASGESCKTK